MLKLSMMIWRVWGACPLRISPCRNLPKWARKSTAMQKEPRHSGLHRCFTTAKPSTTSNHLEHEQNHVLAFTMQTDKRNTNTAFSRTYVWSNAERRRRVKGMGQRFSSASSPVDGLSAHMKKSHVTLSASPDTTTSFSRVSPTFTPAAPTLSAGMEMRLLARGGSAQERVVLMLRFGGSAHAFIKPRSSKLQWSFVSFISKHVSSVLDDAQDECRCTVWVHRLDFSPGLMGGRGTWWEEEKNFCTPCSTAVNRHNFIFLYVYHEWNKSIISGIRIRKFTFPVSPLQECLQSIPLSNHCVFVGAVGEKPDLCWKRRSVYTAVI